MNTLSGHIITRSEGEELEALRRDFQCNLQQNGWIRANPGNWMLPPHFDQVADKIYKFKFRESDIIVNTCPKAGTTWVQEIIWTMKHNPNLDNPEAILHQSHRSPFLENDSHIGTEGPIFDSLVKQAELIIDDVQEGAGIFLKYLDTLPSPRIIKTHLPISLLPPDILDFTKFVYVARNPLDVCKSFYHFSRLLKDINYSGTFEQFSQRFMEGNLIHLPFWEHVHGAWKRRNHHNLHFIFYEDLKQDPYNEILKLNNFLETSLTDEQLQNIVNFTSFSKMKERGIVAFVVAETPEHVNMEIKEKEGGFLRKGIVGDWKNCSNLETIDKMKSWIDSAMKDMEIPFIYEIN